MLKNLNPTILGIEQSVKLRKKHSVSFLSALGRSGRRSKRIFRPALAKHFDLFLYILWVQT